MKNLIAKFETNNRVDYIKPILQPSLEDEDVIKELQIILKTRFNLYDWAKTVYITKTDNPAVYQVKIFTLADSLLQHLFDSHGVDSYKAKYAHEKEFSVFNLDSEGISKVINWMYTAKLN